MDDEKKTQNRRGNLMTTGKSIFFLFDASKPKVLSSRRPKFARTYAHRRMMRNQRERDSIRHPEINHLVEIEKDFPPVRAVRRKQFRFSLDTR